MFKYIFQILSGYNKLHREAYPTIFFVILPTIAVINYSYLKFPLAFFLPIGIGGFTLIVLTLNFFRNPEIEVFKNNNHILSPCDGKVVVIEEVFEPKYFKKNVQQISIFMSPLDVHVNRTPIGGQVIHYEYFKGKFLVAFHPKSSTENEQTFLVMSNERVSVGFKQIAGAVARRIKCYVKTGDVLEQGQEFGFIKFGSRMDILVPLEAKIQIQLHQKVTGGKTILAKIG